MRDARALVDVALHSGLRVTLCGSHHVMAGRCAVGARSIEDLRRLLGDRRDTDRRTRPRGEIDELAERLQAAFTRERRNGDRRAS